MISPKTTSNKRLINDEQLQQLIDVSRAAGEITLKYFRNDPDIIIKENNSPVTVADQEAEALILDVVRSLDLPHPIVAEESFAAGIIPDNSQLDTFWLIDPLDGTKEFVNGRPNYTVNIGLVVNCKAYFGVIYVPVTNELYYGFVGEDHAYRQKSIDGPIEAINVAPVDLGTNKRRVVSSASHVKSERLQAFLTDNDIDPVSNEFYGSSLKMCRLAEGVNDIYPRLAPTSEWDTAAGHAILKAAGGNIYTFDGNNQNEELEYAKQSDYINPFFIARTY